MTLDFPVQNNHNDLSSKLAALLDAGNADFRAEVRDYVASLGNVPPEISMEDHRELTIKRVGEFADAGYAKLLYPEAYGGADNVKDYLSFVEILSHSDLSTVIKQSVNFGLFGGGVTALGTEKHHEKYLSDIMNARLPGGFAMTELGGGSNVQGLQTTAVYNKETDSFTINTPNNNARKAYIGNAAQHGQMMVVFAQLYMEEGSESKGVHAFMVPVRDAVTNKVLPGITIEDHGKKVGLNGVDNGMISFNNVVIPRDSMLDRLATIDDNGEYQSDIESNSARFFKMIGTLVMGRIALSVSSLSAAKNALTQSIFAADQREVFGSTLLDLQATQTRLFPRLAESYALHFATRDLLDDTDKAGDRELETRAAALKAGATDFAFNTIDEARRLGGGNGYIADQRLSDMRDDIDIYRTFEGDNTVLRLLAAKNLLTEFSSEFKDLNPVGRVAKGLSMKFNTVASKLAPRKFDASPAQLMDSGYHMQMFSLREKEMQKALGQNVIATGKALGDTKKAFDQHQDKAIALTNAYSERLMLDKFLSVIDKQNDPETKDTLKTLCDLYAVDKLRANAKWYMENGYMSKRQSSALDTVAHKLGEKIRPLAKDIVAAFSIPQALLPDAPESNIAPTIEPPLPAPTASMA